MVLCIITDNKRVGDAVSRGLHGLQALPRNPPWIRGDEAVLHGKIILLRKVIVSASTLLVELNLNTFLQESREEYFLERPKHVFTAVMRFYTNEEELICPPCIPKFLFEVRGFS